MQQLVGFRLAMEGEVVTSLLVQLADYRGDTSRPRQGLKTCRKMHQRTDSVLWSLRSLLVPSLRLRESLHIPMRFRQFERDP